MLEDLKKNYTSYLGWGLNNFEDFLEAFTKYKDGGWWVRKIDYKDAFNREITDGPYKEKEAKEKAKSWNKFFKFKNLETAKAYSLLELICQHNTDYMDLKNHLYEEYIWRPPKGAELICLIKGLRKVVLYENKENQDDYNFRKFEFYALQNGVKNLEVKGYSIFYLEGDYVSYERAKKLKNLVIDYHGEKEILKWLYLEAINISSYRTGIKPIIIPEYILDFKKDIVPQYLDFFKRLKVYKDKKSKINALLKSLKKYSKNLNTVNNLYTISYTLPLLYSQKDDDIKYLNISYLKDTLKISIKTLDYDISLTDSDLNSGRLVFNFREEKSFDLKLIKLFIFISKTLFINKLYLKDNLTEYCKCNKLSNIPLYLNMVNFLADKDPIYYSLGFRELNYDKRKEIVKPYANKQVIENQGEEIFDNYTYKLLALDYLNGYCKYDYVCEVLQKVTTILFDKLKDCCLEYLLKLETVKMFKIVEDLEN